VKIFIDTNVLVAAFISHGMCAELLEHCMTEHEVYTSDFVLKELRRVLTKKLHYSKQDALQACAVILSAARPVPEAKGIKPLSRDKDDNHIIAAAVSADVDCIISGDDDLLALKKVHGIPVVRPRDFWKLEELHD